MPILAAVLLSYALTATPVQTKKTPPPAVKPVDRNKAVIGQYYPLG